MLHAPQLYLIMSFFFFNDTATTEIYTLSLHDALPILLRRVPEPPAASAAGGRRENVFVAPFVRLAHTVRDIGTFKQADRKSTRLNSSHANISYAVFCLKKKNKK